jgi:hypothetical protein
MTDLSGNRNARVFWLVGVALALSLAVVVPIHLNLRFLPTCGPEHAGLRAAHHTLVERIGSAVEAQIDHCGRAPAPVNLAVSIPVAALPKLLTRTAAAPAQARTLRRLRTAPADADGGDPFSRTAFLRV